MSRIAMFPVWFAGLAVFARRKPPESSYEWTFVGGLLVVMGLLGWVLRVFRRNASTSSVEDPKLGRVALTAATAILGMVTVKGLVPALILPAVLSVLLLCTLSIPLTRTSALTRGLTGLLSDSWLIVSCAVCQGVFWIAEPYLQHVAFRAPLAELLAVPLGIDLHVHGLEYAATRLGVTSFFGASFRYAELFPACLALVIGVALLIGNRRATLTRVLVLLFMAALAREIVFLTRVVMLPTLRSIALDYEHHLWLTTAFYLPLLVGVYGLTASGKKSASLESEATRVRKPRLAFACAALLPVLLLLSTSLHLPGPAKEGRIAVDAGHSQWEWTDVPLNKYLFGTKTTYSYWSLMTILRQHFAAVDSVTVPKLTPDVLARYDVWILKTPTVPYAEDEVSALRAYVEQGGGLWLVGDHTNIFGMNTRLNQVADWFGIHFNADAAFDLPSKPEKQLWQRGSEDRHGVVQALPEFLFATSATLTIDPLRTEPVLLGGDFYADEADYSKLTFFGNHEFDRREPYGRFFQCASARHGKGRVVAFADSTVFSSFYMMIEGKPELAVGTVSWLNHRNSESRLPQVFGAGAVLVGLLGLSLRIRQRTSWDALFRGLTFGAVLAAGADRLADKWTLESLPKPTWTQERVAVLPRDTHALPLRHRSGHEELDDAAYLNWLVALQRDELIPVIVDSVEEALQYPVAMFLDPASGVIRELESRLPAWLDQGGRAWIVSGRAEPLNGLLTAVKRPTDSGLRVEYLPARPIPCEGAESCTAGHDHDHAEKPKVANVAKSKGGQKKSLSAEPPPRVPAKRTKGNVELTVARDRVVVHGFEPLLTTDRGTLQGILQCGPGMLALTTEPVLFSNLELGTTTDVPTRDRYEIMGVIWDTLDRFYGRPATWESRIPEVTKSESKAELGR